MKYVMKNPDEVPIKLWADSVEDSAMKQLHNVAKMPFVHSHVASMADAHWGNGTAVGSVIATRNAIIPSAVGVDIGCGMMAWKLNMQARDLPDSLGALRSNIESAVPHGRTNDGKLGDRGAWGIAPQAHQDAMTTLRCDERILEIEGKHPKLIRTWQQPQSQIGTLGTGNHFIEVCLDKEQNVWVMLHSGSRGIGNRIGQYFIERAKEMCERWHVKLPDPELAYLVKDDLLFHDYWLALSWAQRYAVVNRELMMASVIGAIRGTLRREVEVTETAINCHHNYVSIENHHGENVYVTRKGAVRAREGDLGIVPGSMGARSYIVRGKGNPESFHSCSHGAGRSMSRGEARRRFTLEDLAAQTAGVECRKDADVIDEIPGAYKDIEVVMANQADLVDVVAELHQVLCVKG
jgi:tRNA-splicing ligase RtcB (3'-phosphate/5'-hydroxy nucleic acid ligase)